MGNMIIIYMLYGGMAMLLVSLITYFFVFKKEELIYFMFFSLCLIIFITLLIFPGFEDEWKKIGIKATESIRNVFIFWAIGFYYLFIVKYLDSENNRIVFNRIIRFSEMVLFFTGAILLARELMGSRNQLVVRFCYLVYFGNYFVQAYLIIDLFRRREKNATIIAIGSLVMLLIIKVALLPNFQAEHFDENVNRATIYIIIGVIINILFFTFTMMRNFQEADREISKFELIKAKELMMQRQEISNDLHDDLGATLSSLHIYSAIATKFVYENPGKARANLGLISSGVFTLMEKINDVIWSVSTKQSNVSLLSTRIKDFFVEIFDSTGIKCSYDIDEELESSITGLKSRKFLLLIAKEAINNAIKHSKAENIKLTILKQGMHLRMSVEDDGIGIGELDFNKGNGLSNLKYRTEQLGGYLSIENLKSRGTAVECYVPLTNIRA